MYKMGDKAEGRVSGIVFVKRHVLYRWQSSSYYLLEEVFQADLQLTV